MATKKIVTVWLDQTSDEHGWIVDTDTEDGGESNTLKVFPPTEAGRKKANAYAKTAAEKRGCPVRLA